MNWVQLLFSDPLALKKQLHRAHKATGKAEPLVLMDMIGCALKYGASPSDYTLFGMYEMNGEQREKVLTAKKNAAYIHTLNRKEYRHFFTHKTEFLTLFAEEIGREYLDLNQATSDEFLAFARRHPIVMAKPEGGNLGENIEKLNTDDHDSCVTLYNTLKTGNQTLIEEVLEQHPALNELYSNAVNTVRAVTMLDEEGQPHLLFAALRVGSGGLAVDNLKAGGLVVPISLEKGTLTEFAVNRKGEVFPAHPDTAVSFGGVSVPLWEECCALALKAAVKVPGIRLAGWDIAITPQRPVLVEGNCFPEHELYQLAPKAPEERGFLPVFDRVVPYSTLRK